ncbi:MAG: recombinase family protein [Alphaproteobacteria bacterium]
MAKIEKTLLSIRAAQYVRTATVDSNRSTGNSQESAIREFAAWSGVEIVRTYADDGKSGLTLDGRDALRQMFQDVESGDANYEVVLLWDVSRWGRDQSIIHHCEQFLEQHGIRIEYCAERIEHDDELFASDGSIASVVIKTIKRVMVREYSRELSRDPDTPVTGSAGASYRETAAMGRQNMAAVPLEPA